MGNPRQVVVAPDGTRVLVVGDTGSAVVRLADGVAESVDPAATGIVSVDPSGRFAAVGGARLTIWDLANGRLDVLRATAGQRHGLERAVRAGGGVHPGDGR